MYLIKSLSENRAREGDRHILLRWGLRKRHDVWRAPQNEPVPDGFRISSKKATFTAAIVAAALATVLAVNPVRADGLLFQLPADGTWARFDMEMAGSDPSGGEVKMSGVLTMSSVGKDESGGEPCRWIEIKMEMKEGPGGQTVVAKALIPEKNLKRGENPWANMKKAWMKQGPNSDPQAITEANGPDAGPMPAFLSGPLTDSMDLGVAEVESGIGKLECKGVSGSLKINDGRNDVEITMESRLHEMAPFGVVASNMKFQVKRDGEDRESGTIKFKLAEVGQDAKSALPDSQ